MAQFNSLLVTGDSRFINPINGNARNGVYNVIGTQASATSAWTGLLPIPSLYTGLQINYFLPYASTSTAVTLALTLATGVASSAIACYVDGTTRLSDQYTSGNTITLTYYASGDISIDGTATSAARWVVSADANSTASVTDSDPTLAWGTQSTVATIDGTAIHVTMPSNPDTDTHRPIQVEGTEILGDNTTPLNFVAGTNVTFSDDGSGSLTITSSNTNAITQNYSTVTAGGNGIKQYSLFARLPDGTYSSFTTNGGTSAKTFDTTNYFDIRKLYQANLASAVAVGNNIGTTVMRYCIGSFDARYSFTGVTTSTSTSSMTAGLPVYYMFDPTQVSNKCYKLKSPYYTQTPSDTDAIYVLIGYMRDSYRLSIWPSNLAFTYDGTNMIPFNGDANTVNGYKVLKSVPGGALFTDGYSTLQLIDKTADCTLGQNFTDDGSYQVLDYGRYILVNLNGLSLSGYSFHPPENSILLTTFWRTRPVLPTYAAVTIDNHQGQTAKWLSSYVYAGVGSTNADKAKLYFDASNSDIINNSTTKLYGQIILYYADVLT